MSSAQAHRLEAGCNKPLLGQPFHRAGEVISPREMVELQMDALYGATLPSRIQAIVNAELDAGRWHRGYDLAVDPNGIDQRTSESLLEILLSQYSDWRIDAESLQRSIEQNLPQSILTSLLWLVAQDSSIVMTDGLRVARYRLETPVWVSPRISLDGIALDSAGPERVEGRSFGLSSYSLDKPFALDFESGSVLEGETWPD